MIVLTHRYDGLPAGLHTFDDVERALGKSVSRRYAAG